jgi:hypothetical protein
LRLYLEPSVLVRLFKKELDTAKMIDIMGVNDERRGRRSTLCTRARNRQLFTPHSCGLVPASPDSRHCPDVFIVSKARQSS